MAGVIDGLPYPTGTDRVVDGDNAIQALAAAVAKNPGPPQIVVPLVAGWVTVAGSTLTACAVNGQVFLTGRISRSSGSSNTIGTLPSGYRPIGDVFADVPNYVGTATPGVGIQLLLNISAAGVVSVIPIGAALGSQVLYFGHTFPRGLL